MRYYERSMLQSICVLMLIQSTAIDAGDQFQADMMCDIAGFLAGIMENAGLGDEALMKDVLDEFEETLLELGAAEADVAA